MKIKNVVILASVFMGSFGGNVLAQKTVKSKAAVADNFDYIADRFADVQVLHYKVHGFDQLSLKQKQLAYYLTEAGLSGRDIFYDQKYRYGIALRKSLENILQTYKGERKGDEWNNFELYCKRFFFSNENHHHYSADKIIPTCSKEYFQKLIDNSDKTKFPWFGKNQNEEKLSFMKVVYDPDFDPKNVDLSAKDVIAASCNNFYRGLTQKEVEDYYNDLKLANPNDRSQMGFNSQLVKENGKIVEKRWKQGGLYGQAIDKIIFWLEKAVTVAENDAQKKSLQSLIKFYKSGNPIDYDTYAIDWVGDTSATIDVVNGFIEVYQDALQKKSAFESVVSMKDMEATKRIALVSHEAQWFEDNSPILPEHKKKEVRGITAKVITVISECGDAAPATPIGINLPNNEWIREDHGSKSVSLGNIIEAYNYYKAKSPMIDEFGASEAVKARVRQYAALAGELHTDLHEVIGHASGQINKGVGTTDQTLKNYAGVLEEARADLVGLYYIMDPKLVELGVSPSIEVGKAQYDSYIMNGLMLQLQRIEPGKNLEEAHMRNRQLISSWAFKQGEQKKVIEKVIRDGKTYFVINDYNELRKLFGDLLREIQRIKSEGDFEAGKNLVENFGVQVDQAMLKEVHDRYEKLNIAPYMGFIQPKLIPVMKDNKIVDVKVEYPKDLLTQMLDYGKNYSFLPAYWE
jgi:dipeptidyl-peptidase-3